MKVKHIALIIAVVGITSVLAGCAFKNKVEENNMSEKYTDGILGYQKHQTKFKDVPAKLKDDMKDTTNQFKDNE